MPKFKTHQEHRESQCAICFKRSGLRIITEKMESIIQTLVCSTFSLSRSGLPVAVCGACRMSLTYVNKVNASELTISVLPFLQPKVLRGEGLDSTSPPLKYGKSYISQNISLKVDYAITNKYTKFICHKLTF